MSKPTLKSKAGFIYLPLGDNPTTLQHTAAERLTELYHLHMHRSVECCKWEFKTEVLQLAKVLLGNFKTWYDLQIESNLYEYHHTFIDDTIQYVTTGHRRYSHRVMAELIEGSTRTTTKHSKRGANATPMVAMSVTNTSDLLAKWCQHRNGFDDMLCTLYVFFGISRENAPER